MTPAIVFYFDFSSPYSYIACHQIEALAKRHGRVVDWRPMLLGAVFQTTGGKPLVDIPLKGDYSKRDFARSAHLAKLAFKLPTVFPVSTVNAARAALWIKQHAPTRTGDFIRAASAAYFAQDRAINDIGVIHDIAAGLGLDADAVTAGIQDPVIKDALKAANNDALARGVFGAPFMFVDDEPFWGQDRLAQLEHWLAHGPF